MGRLGSARRDGVRIFIFAAGQSVRRFPGSRWHQLRAWIISLSLKDLLYSLWLSSTVPLWRLQVDKLKSNSLVSRLLLATLTNKHEIETMHSDCHP